MEELEHAQQEEAFFTVESVITPKDYRALYYFNIFHKNKTIKVLSVVIAACMLVVLSSALILDDSKMLTRAITFIVVVFLAEWGVLELGVRRIIKGDTISINNPSGYTLYRDRIEVFSQKTEGHATYTWEMVTDAWQTREYFYLFLGVSHVIILKKQGMGRQEIGLDCRPADLLEPEVEKMRAEVPAEYLEQEEDVLTWAMFPQVAPKFFEKRKNKKYGVDGEHADKKDMVHPV